MMPPTLSELLPTDPVNTEFVVKLESKLSFKFYYQMYLIRIVEQQFLDLFSQGLVNGTVHTSLGQEACAVGVINALDKDKDVIFSNHRAHGHFLAYCDDLDGLVAEIMGRKTGVCGGIGGSQHLHQHNMYTNGVQGGIIPNAVGAALAEKLKGSGAICIVFLGDGTMGQGTVYESLNIASLWSLPILFVLEDNGYAQSTPKHLEHAGDIASRPDTFLIPREVIKADDVFKVYEVAQTIVRKIRNEGRPFFLTLNTYRLGPHSKGDDTRPSEEIEAYWEKDPLKHLAGQLPRDIHLKIEKMVELRVRDTIEKTIKTEFQTIQDLEKRLGCRIK